MADSEYAWELFPKQADFPTAVLYPAEEPADTATLRVMSKAHDFECLAQFKSLRKLWCWDIHAERLEVLSRCVALTHLYVTGFRGTDLSPLAKLRGLRVLRVAGATKVMSLDWVAGCTWLDELSLEHFKRVSSLEPLRSLTQLRALDVSGSIWTRMRVESLAPLSGLKALRLLSLSNLKAKNSSLVPLRELVNLVELRCAGYYSMEEFARLAAALPQTQCMWFEPYVEVPNLSCKKCGRKELAMLTGSGAGVRCLACEEPLVRKHEAMFREMVLRERSS